MYKSFDKANCIAASPTAGCIQLHPDRSLFSRTVPLRSWKTMNLPSTVVLPKVKMSVASARFLVQGDLTSIYPLRH